MSKPTLVSFQDTVRQNLFRHKSILDTMSKLDESSARLNRAITKAVTACGCLKINASRKQRFSEDLPYDLIKEQLTTHLEGELCPDCREHVEEEAGRVAFYLTALCDTLGMSLEEIISSESGKLIALGKFSLR
ncbi:MAG TPA: DUF1573 domain-containing protein [Bacillota bacterium]|nr:DUF1573 domain-containing protein [Bacillota bacterium]